MLEMKTNTGPYPTPYIDVYINVLCTYKTIPEKGQVAYV